MARLRLPLCLSLLAAVLLAALFNGSAQAAVTLIYFRGWPGEEQAILEWETGSELNNAGFYVNRSLEENGVYQRVSPFILAQGDGFGGAEYSYTDTGLTNHTRYYYKLETISSTSTSEFYGPIWIVPGEPPPTATPAQTRTPTLTKTPTRTATPVGTASFTATPSPTATLTGSNPATHTPQITLTPTRTPLSGSPYPLPGTAIPGSQAQTPQSQQLTQTAESGGLLPTGALTPGLGGTATLQPLPQIDIQFPTLPPTRPATATRQVTPVPPGNPLEEPSPIVMVVMGVVAFWLLLAVWFFFTLRRIQ